MKVLIVGSGGREHAIAWSVSRSPKADKIYCAPGNAGIEEYAECVNIGAMEFDKLVAFAKEKEIDLTIIGMDDPLVGGVVDAFEAEGLRVFGPRKNAAIIEGSKAFSKDLMKKYSYDELFTDNKQKNTEKYSIKFPKNTVESKVDLQQLAAKQNIPFSQFEFGNTDTEMAKYSIMNYVQNNRIIFDDYGVRCATTSASYSIPTEMANFEFVLDDNFAYTIEDPNGYIVYYGLTTSIK